MKPILIILRKEATAFFSSSAGYVAIGGFLLINGLFLWVFKGGYNILENGFADLSAFFGLAPWTLMFLAPAITMRAFSEEFKTGTIETLLTKPITQRQLIVGKFLGAAFLAFLAFIPTLCYVYSVWQLGSPVGNISLGVVFTSYLGLILTALVFISLGTFTSTLSENQVVAFLSAVLANFLCYYGFEAISEFGGAFYMFHYISLQYHLDNLGTGLLSSSDVLFFLLSTLLFLALAEWNICRILGVKKLSKSLTIIWILIATGYFLSSHFYARADFTKDKRYTFSEATNQAALKISKEMVIEVFLEGDLPPIYKKLQAETLQVLKEFSALNPLIKFVFVNPLEKSKDPSQTLEELAAVGIFPQKTISREGASVSEKLIFPWALINYDQRIIKVPLLKNKLGLPQEALINLSVSQLEYAFATAFSRITVKQKKGIAILKGNGELGDLYIADFLNGLKESYGIAPFTLDSVEASPEKTFEKLSKFDLAVMAKPTRAFSDKEKQVLDQYVMNGGKLLLMIDKVQADLDSLVAASRYFAIPKDLNLDDMLFKYGVRINPVLVKDLSFSDIVLAQGKGTGVTYHKVPWQYAPLVVSEENHPINKQVAPVRLDFAGSIDTLENDISKTVLLRSSAASKSMNTPREIRLEYVLAPPEKSEYTDAHMPVAVLLEGRFTSVYHNRVKPFDQGHYKDESPENKIIIVADGDIAKNQLDEGKPLELGYDKWTNESYGNRDFLLNCVNYLMGDSGLLSIRTKSVDIPFLDREKAYKEASYWKALNVAAPLVGLAIHYVIYTLLRRRRYTAKRIDN